MRQSHSSTERETNGTNPVPSNTDAEEAVIGGLLLEGRRLSVVSSFLRPDDFYRERNGQIFAAMVALSDRSEPIDFISVCGELERHGKLAEVGNSSYIASMVNAVPTTVHLEHYAKTVVRMATYRRMIALGGRVAALGYEQPDSTDDAMAQIEAMLYDLRTGRNTGKIITPQERANRALTRYEAAQAGQKQGIPFGFGDLDALTQGAQPGQLILVAGRPSMGKTSWMQCMAERMAQAGHKTLFCSAEMSEAELTDRTVAGRIKRSVHALQECRFSEDVWFEVCEVVGKELAEEPLHIYDDPDMTTASIRAVATEMRSRYGLDALFVDYLQILHDSHGKSDNERVSYISRQLKATARSLGVPLICGSQLNRDCEDRPDKRPTLSDLRDSGSLEQDADVVLLLYRAGYYWPTEGEWKRRFREQPYPGSNVTEAIIAKQRQGKRGIHIKLYFDGTTMQFAGVDERHG